MNAVAKIAAADFRSLERRVENYNWDAIGSDLNALGSAILEKLLTANECYSVASLYANDEHFRSRVNMARHGFGRGRIQVFQISAANRHCGIAHRSLFAHRDVCQCVERTDECRREIS